MAASAQQAPRLSRVDLEQAIQLAIKHNHALKAAENTIQQSEAEEITAAIRPNPVFTYDDLYVPIFSPSQLNSTTLDNITEFDLGFSYTFERGHKRQARIDAAKDATAVTRSQVKDNERSLTANVAQQFIEHPAGEGKPAACQRRTWRASSKRSTSARSSFGQAPSAKATC